MNRAPRLAAALVLLTAVAVLAGCGGSSPTSEPAPAGDAILIATISPATGTKLAPGSTVNFQATVNYRLVSAATGTVAMLVEDQSGHDIPMGQVGVNVTMGERAVNISTHVTIPATGVTLIQLVCSLSPTGNPAEIVQSNINYPVGV
jgi:hypothetical protein